jgi:murein L,D-transpeptidase YcbB/YkuD
MKYFGLAALIFIVMACSQKQNDIVHNPNNDSTQEVVNDYQDTLEAFFNTVRDTAAMWIRTKLENFNPETRYVVHGQQLYSSELLPNIYVHTHFKPLWFHHANDTSWARSMLRFLEDLTYHGLQPNDYHFEVLNELIGSEDLISENMMDGFSLAEIDMLLTDAYLIAASHLYNGKVDPNTLRAQWGIQRDKPFLKLDEKLLNIRNYENLAVFMQQFYPNKHGYRAMVRTAKQITKRIGQDTLVNIPLQALPIKIDEDTLFQETIAQRLKQLGFISQSDTLNTSVLDALKTYQFTLGLNQDGVIGRRTLDHLNTTFEQRLNKLFVNLERIRWMPQKRETHRIHVNIADYQMHYLRNDDTLISMKTQVGRDLRQTPVFDAKMTYLVFSPTWTVPPGILRNDVIPAVARDLSYLNSKNMVVLDRSGQRVDPTQIDWQKARRGAFPYTIRQMPGDDNALGRVKFMFPNKYNVYLHDTPSKRLFEQDERLFSSGCVRIENPIELAELLLNDSIQWSRENVLAAMRLKNERAVTLRQPVQVYIYYMTAWSDGKHTHYRNDVYSRDEETLKALRTSVKN